MSSAPTKEYGLIIPNKNKNLLTKSLTPFMKPSIFESDSDSDETGGKPAGISRVLKREEKVVQAKAIEEDPTIYQYDELYEEMDQKRKDSKLSRKDLDRKPKYISKLLKAAEKRKLENERRIERQVQRDREAEGDKYQDKESFVTSGYKKKLEEMKEQEELAKREEYLEAIGDVTKQGNLDGFYRHLYEQKVNYDEDKEKKMEDIKNAVDQQHSSSEDTDSAKKDIKDITPEDGNKPKTERKRQYRIKQYSNSEGSEDEINKEHKEHLPSNLDADSDFSIDSDSDSDSEGEPKQKVVKKDNKEVDMKCGKDNKRDKVTDETNGTIDNGGNVEDEKDAKEESKVNIEEVKPTKPKIDIWKKRTVGEVFDAALQRYFERKAMREG